MSNRPTQIKLVMLSTEKKTGYYFDKKKFKKIKKHTIPPSNQLIFFLYPTWYCNGRWFDIDDSSVDPPVRISRKQSIKLSNCSILPNSFNLLFDNPIIHILTNY